MSWRLLHLGDCHIRAGEHQDDTERCLSAVIDIIEERNVDIVLIPGDIYESKSTPVEREMFREWLGALRDGGFVGPVIICRGNHDAPKDLLVWDIADDVYICEKPGIFHHGRLDVLVIPWPEKAHLAAAGITGEANEGAGGAALANMIRLMAETRDDTSRPLVGMGHLSVTGAATSSGQPMIGREIQIGAGDLADTGAAYWALNHIHKHQELSLTPPVVYAGSLTGHDHGETEPKGVVFVEIDDEGAASWEFVRVPARKWVTIDATVISEAGTIEERDAWTPDYIADANIRYRYACTAEQSHLFDHAEIEARFADAHTLKIVPEIERTERVRAAEVAEAKTPEEKLRAWGVATDTPIPESAVEKLGELSDSL